MMRNFILSAIFAVMISGCGGAAVNYRSMAGYEAVNKHWCAVKDVFFMPDEKSSAADYGVKTYFLCCPVCADTFKANPMKYARAVISDDGKEHNTRKRSDGHGGGFSPGGGAGSGGGSCH